MFSKNAPVKLSRSTSPSTTKTVEKAEKMLRTSAPLSGVKFLSESSNAYLSQLEKLLDSATNSSNIESFLEESLAKLSPAVKDNINEQIDHIIREQQESLVELFKTEMLREGNRDSRIMTTGVENDECSLAREAFYSHISSVVNKNFENLIKTVHIMKLLNDI